MLALTAGEIAIIAKWDGSPIYAKNLAMSILCDTKNGTTKTIDKLRERQYGKPTQKIELTGADGTPLMQPKSMTQEEARAFIAKLENDY
jgi:hypothetical protein